MGFELEVIEEAKKKVETVSREGEGQGNGEGEWKGVVGAMYPLTSDSLSKSRSSSTRGNSLHSANQRKNV